MGAALDIPHLIASRYVPIRLIARGGMGAVYEVEHAHTGERLALKVLHAGVGASGETRERFKREARASARIKSEHVVRVTDADVAPELGGAPFLVMELLDGTDLERAPLRPGHAVVVDWLRQVAAVIDRAHGLGIVHRDLKPENLFLCRREGLPDIVKILDFGIIKVAEEQTAASQAGRIVGTPQYMAPEQLSAQGQITSAVDRYALGLVAYRLVTGEPWYRGDVMSVLAQILHEPLGRPSDRHPELGGAFDAWFARACHRSAGDRFPSAEEQIEALAAVLGLPTIAVPVTRSAAGPAPVVATTRRRSAVALAVGVALLGAGVAVLLLSRRPEEARPAPTVAAPPAASPPSAATPPPAAAVVERPGPTVAAPPPSVPLGPAHGPRVRQHRKASATPPETATPVPIDPYADQK